MKPVTPPAPGSCRRLRPRCQPLSTPAWVCPLNPAKSERSRRLGPTQRGHRRQGTLQGPQAQQLNWCGCLGCACSRVRMGSRGCISSLIGVASVQSTAVSHGQHFLRRGFECRLAGDFRGAVKFYSLAVETEPSLHEVRLRCESAAAFGVHYSRLPCPCRACCAEGSRTLSSSSLTKHTPIFQR